MTTSSKISPAVSIDWAAERARFPACRNGVYLKTASTGPISDAVYSAYISQADTLHQTGGIEAPEAIVLIDGARKGIQKLVDAPSLDDVAMASNTSMAMNIVAMMLKSRWTAGKIVLMPQEEFPSSSVPFHHHGLPVQLVPVETLANAIEREKARLGAVVCSQVQFGMGYRQDLVALGEQLAALGVPFIVNATQGLGAFPVSVQTARITALAASSHKWLCSGYGISAVYLSAQFRAGSDWPLAGWLSVADPHLMSSGHPTLLKSALEIQTGTLPFPTVAGLDASIGELLRIGPEAIGRRILDLSSYLVARLRKDLPGVELITPRDDGSSLERSINSGIVSLKAADADAATATLEHERIFVSARRGALRIATHYFNDESDIDRLVEALARLGSSLRS